ncbi:MAG: 4-hydroxy-3-methylbut-2-enyl diphosphate reductase, partial [Oscillospiraceae bacterium]|nr:4-hydroxy-3-methylbut-2-enyl diphosphate reductase [Oscillospiraceae bacterium]
MKIVLAKSAGFCFGVKRAVDIAQNLAAQADIGKRVLTLGPIIHNDAVVNDLKKQGVTAVDKPSDAQIGDVLVLRSHGVAKKIIDEIKLHKIDYVDATCPFVSKIHKIVATAEENSFVLIAGDALHPEVVGIIGHCKGDCAAFNNAEELVKVLAKISLENYNSVILVSQTTFDKKEFEKSVKYFKKVCTNGKIFDTICNATSERQTEAEMLSKNCDAMLVIGGKHSSNTKKLYEICKANCKNSFLVEDFEELQAVLSEFDFCNVKILGVTAGASTPGRIIEEVLDTMCEVNTSGETVAEVTEEIAP